MVAQWFFLLLVLIYVTSAGAFIGGKPWPHSMFNVRRVSAACNNDGTPVAHKPHIIDKYDVLPYTMFRLLNTKAPNFKARVKSDSPGSYDIVATDGVVKPLDSTLFSGPNGASLRPNTYEEYYLVSSRSAKSHLCEIPKGTRVPEKCVLVHEFGDHFSLQPRVEMSIELFNKIVTKFLSLCKVYKRDEWMKEYFLGSQLSL